MAPSTPSRQSSPLPLKRKAATGPTYTFAPLTPQFSDASAVCIGTGRFLRAVLVPALHELGCGVVLAQTRGTSFCAHMAECTEYEVDTVATDGSVQTARLPVAACGSLGLAEGRAAFLALPATLKHLRYIGLGLTEAGLVANNASISDLAELLHACSVQSSDHFISVINTDNVPFNGDLVRSLVRTCDVAQGYGTAFGAFLERRVVFHNSMVDRITSHRVGDPDVPRAEPLPEKALVIEDLGGVLPEALGAVRGVVVRTAVGRLGVDIALKLRIANATHSAMALPMALGRRFTTEQCAAAGSPVLPYLEQLFERDIVGGLTTELGVGRPAVEEVFAEWVSRLRHAHFGLDCFFIAQNATQKLGLRLMPSASEAAPSPFLAFALAATLRFLTPVGDQPRIAETPPVFCGRLDDAADGDPPPPPDWKPTPALRVRPADGIYEFSDGDGAVPLLLRPLGQPGAVQEAFTAIATEALSRVDGCDPAGSPAHAALVGRAAEYYERMLGERALDVLASLLPEARGLRVM